MPPANKQFDLNKHASDPTKHVEFTLNVKPPETPLERKHRLAEEAHDTQHERKKDLLILYWVLIGVTIIMVVCVGLVFMPHTSPEDKKWATAVLASSVTLGMGYLLGKGKASK
jgi:hypothetical protein